MTNRAAPAALLKLTTPLPCWHESRCSARTDLVVSLSMSSAFIATDRPLPPGTPVYLDLDVDNGGAAIDGVSVASAEQGNGFAVEFVSVDERAQGFLQALLGVAHGPRRVPLPRSYTPTSPGGPPLLSSEESSATRGGKAPLARPEAGGVLGTAPHTPAPVREAMRMALPSRITESQLQALPIEAPPPPVEPAPTTLAPAEIAWDVGVPVAGRPQPVATPASSPMPGLSLAALSPRSEPATRTLPNVVPSHRPGSWSRALAADLPLEESSDVENTQRWPTARVRSDDSSAETPSGEAPRPSQPSTPPTRAAPIEGAAAVTLRPLPAPDDDDVALVTEEVADFDEVIGVRSFRSEGPPPQAPAPGPTPLGTNPRPRVPIAEPGREPPAATLPSRPAQVGLAPPPRMLGPNPFADESQPPLVPGAPPPPHDPETRQGGAPLAGSSGSATSLPAPRLLAEGFNALLTTTGGASNSPAPHPLPQISAAPAAPAPGAADAPEPWNVGPSTDPGRWRKP